MTRDAPSAESLVRPGAQQRLALERPWPLDRESFIASPANAAALQLIETDTAWPEGRLALIGPEGSGKTHLAAIWAARAGAQVIAAADLRALHAGGPLVIEDADRGVNARALFAVHEAAGPSAPALLTARTRPRDWPLDLPDLRSRLNAMMLAELSSPDDEVLSAMLDRFFRERNIVPPKSVTAFLLRRIERSAAAARRAVEQIDEAASQSRRNITRDLAREVLGEV